jgi:hypothetical protein
MKLFTQDSPTHELLLAEIRWWTREHEGEAPAALWLHVKTYRTLLKEPDAPQRTGRGLPRFHGIPIVLDLLGTEPYMLLDREQMRGVFGGTRKRAG